jgi:molybdopterin/thiamine biosynthesis adenylyltransferase/nitroreductase
VSRAPSPHPPDPASRGFDPAQAFARTVGWVTERELAVLRRKRVAIAGLGGVGGAHLLALTRLGVGRIHAADFDRFELTNFNRQAGAGISTLGREKSEVLAEMARDVNPELEISVFSEGVHDGNLGAFLDGADLYLDGLDFFAVEARRAVFAACARRGVPAVTAAPLGMGVALLNFLPGGMTFEEYFDLEGASEPEQLLRFLIGLAPAMLQRGYLVDFSSVDLARHRGPSTPMACELCAGVAATEVLKILLGRGRVIAAPRGVQFDAYRNRLVRTWRPGGNRNPLQRIALAVARRQLGARTHGSGPSPVTEAASEIEAVLGAARWAPSGDNVQPWRFEISGRRRAVLRGHDAGRDGVYDLRGHARALSFGALLETVEIAATGLGLRARLRRRPQEALAWDLELVDEPGSRPHPLLDAIPRRTVLRRPMRRRPLSAGEKKELEASVAPDFRVEWIEGPRRLAMARVNFANAGLRLSLPEAYPVHREVIAWRRRFSEEGIPGRSLGVDPVTRRLMEWGMRSWRRVSRLNRAGGTLLPRLEMELLPGVFCAAHFFLLAERPPGALEDFVAAGRAVQRFWLTATRLGLFVQPEMTPLIFRRYAADGVAFSREPWAEEKARRIADRLDRVAAAAERAVFLGRIGAGRVPSSRSVRLSLDRLTAAPKP